MQRHIVFGSLLFACAVQLAQSTSNTTLAPTSSPTIYIPNAITGIVDNSTDSSNSVGNGTTNSSNSVGNGITNSSNSLGNGTTNTTIACTDDTSCPVNSTGERIFQVIFILGVVFTIMAFMGAIIVYCLRWLVNGPYHSV
jgi:hypothetical protein